MNPTSVPLSSGGTGSSTLTVAVPLGTAPGDYSVFVEATGGCSLFHFAIISVTVTGPDFTIVAESPHLTIAQGLSDTSKIDLASKNGFVGTVTLFASGFPLMTSLSSPTVILTPGGTGTSTLTIFAPAATEPGNYTVTVYASSGLTLFHSAHVIVTVTGPTFAISASPQSLTVEAGGPSTSSTITITPLGGFMGTVSLTFSSFPSGLMIKLLPASVTLPPAGISTLTVSAPSGTKPRTFFVDITGTSGPVHQSTTVVVTVKGPDFDISIDPSFIAVVAGGPSCTSTIAVTSIDSFTGTVGLKAVQTSTSNQFLTVMLSVASVTVPGTATLTVSAQVNMIPGFYSVDVNGTSTSPALTHIETINVIVIGPDFSLSATPDSLTVTAGGLSVTSIISMTAENGFSSTVALTTSADDPGISVSLSPSTVTSAMPTSTLTVTVAPGTVPGDFYYVQVNGTSGALTHSIYVPITVIGPDFSLSANPPSLTFNAGTSTTSQIIVSPILGFTGLVDLNVFPSFNLNASIQPTTVASGSSTATLSVNSTIPGVYSVDIFGSSGGLFHDLTVPVTVQGPDFSISSAPPSLTITAGAPQMSTISLSPVNGFTGTASLTASTPAGFAANFNPTSISPTSTSILTVSVDSTVSPGHYSVTVIGTSGSSLIHQVDIPVTVTAPDFMISAGAVTPTTILAGSSGTSVITIAPQNGFTGTVTFTISLSTPSGLTCGPMNVIYGSGTSTLSCTASAAGDYTEIVTGTAMINGSPVSHATNVILFHIVGFSIAAGAVTPSAIPAGGLGTSTILITPVNGFSGTVAFAVSASLGLMCEKLTDIGSGSGTGTLSCSAATAGDYAVTVTGTSGTLSRTTNSIVFHVVDFTISANSPTAVNPDTSATSTITVTALNGFSGTVTLTSSPAAGLTCLPLASVALPPSPRTSTLSCSASSAGDYTVTVTGASGSLSHDTATLTVHVVASPTPDFGVALSSSSQSFNSGSSATTTITINPNNGFAGTVTLTVTAPAGISCNIAPTTLQPSGAYPTSSSTLTCTSSTPGDYTVTINAGGGATPHHTNVAVHVASVPSQTPPAPSTIFGLEPIVFYALVVVIVGAVAAGAGATVILRRRKP